LRVNLTVSAASLKRVHNQGQVRVLARFFGTTFAPNALPIPRAIVLMRELN
jgi:hypothetical protein